MNRLIIDELERIINKTPTGGLRNELTDINILIHSSLLKWNDYGTKKPDLSKLKANEKKCIYCLVEIEFDGKLEYEIATFHPNIISIGGNFEFDRAPIKRWIYLNDILEVINE